VTLQLQPLIMRGEPILDVLPLEQSLLVLGTENLILQRAEGNDSERQVAVVTHTQPWPRDPRGRLWTDGVVVQAYLPGTRCKGTLRPLALACADSQEPWPLDGGDATLVPGRNYFEAEGIRPFFSTARPGSAAGTLLLIAGIDGKSYLYNSNRETIAIIDGLGSDLASLQSSCGSGAQILAAVPGEQGNADFLQALEWINLQARPASTPTRVSGAITALWPVPGTTSAILIAHDSEAGRYEAYRVSVACSR
jgi:hypothetical protein